MRKIKYFIIFLTIFGSLFFLFGLEVLPENFQFQEFLNSASQNDVIIIFNSGGWGNTPLEKAEDFSPIIEGLQETLNEWGYNSIVIPYERTKNNFFGKITGIKGTVKSSSKQTEKLAKEIERFLKENPGKKIIIAGLSSGAAFADKTMEKVSENLKNQIYAIETGTPFWEKTLNSENVLCLNNKGKDPLSKGEMKILLPTLFKAPFKWFLARVSGQNLTFSQAIQVPGHEYFWSEVKPEITSFLENKLK